MEENTESLGTDPVKFIIMDSQCESEDPDLMHLPALQMTQVYFFNQKTIFNNYCFLINNMIMI